MGFSCGSVVKNLPANAGDAGSIRGLRTFPRGGNGNPLQYSCLENPIDRGAWQITVHWVTESDTTEHNGICKWKMRLRREKASQPLAFVRFWCPMLLPSWSLWLWLCMRAQLLSHIHLFVTPWTVACQSPLSMGFPR